jgi:hypothetical protein
VPAVALTERRESRITGAALSRCGRIKSKLLFFSTWARFLLASIGFTSRSVVLLTLYKPILLRNEDRFSTSMSEAL